MDLIRRLVGAVQFLTIVPLPWRGAPVAQSAGFFPLVGAAIGALGALVLHVLGGWLPGAIAALLVAKLWSWISGSLHEDGLADSADAFRAGRSPSRIHTILKDSRIGTYGAVALIFAILLRWQALIYVAVDPLPLFVAAHAVPRAAVVVLAWGGRPLNPGPALPLMATLSTSSMIVAALFGVGFAAWNGWRLGWMIVAVSAAAVILSRHYFERRLGGITGDCLGAVSQGLEILILLLGTCRSCSW